MREVHSIFFDFDSILIAVESLDEMLKMSIDKLPMNKAGRRELAEQIEAITHSGMNGKIDLQESLEKRLALARVHRRHINSFIDLLMAGQLFTPGTYYSYVQ